MHPTHAELNWLLAQAQARRWRTMRQFAEAEVIIPAGPFEGRRFRCDRQPYTGLWFDAVDSGRWTRCVATGPTQSGKTLACFIIPLLYHLFEIGETVVCGLPDMDMASDKWREDVLPVIEQSRYRDLLPVTGGGSRGGRVESIRFTNGATLKFMSGGGSDKSRAGFTTRVVVITETDGMDRPGSASRESDKITQLEARTRAFGSRARVYMECTVSTEHGRTWQEYTNGTRSRIVLACPHCRDWVSPEREHLIGWKEVGSAEEARAKAAFRCPRCGKAWSPEQRIEANRDARLLHHGEQIEADGAVGGSSPPTNTLGFRWSAVHNLFLTAGEFAADEWRAARSVDEENAEREMRQFIWCIPVAPASAAQVSLEWTALAARVVEPGRGVVPKDAQWITVGIDIGKYLLHWIAVAWSENACGHVVDYGRVEVAADDLGVEHAVLVALRQFQDDIAAGWPVGTLESAEMKAADQVWIDSGYLPEVIHAFCRQAEGNFHPILGRGTTQSARAGAHARPSREGVKLQEQGEGWQDYWLAAEQLHRIEVDADHWKTWVHERLHTPVGQPGAMMLFQASPDTHLALARHLTAERKIESYVAGRGVVVQWERLRRQNHWLDALYIASAAGSLCGARLVGEPQETVAEERRPWRYIRRYEDDDGRPWVDVERARENIERLLGGG